MPWAVRCTAHFFYMQLNVWWIYKKCSTAVLHFLYWVFSVLFVTAAHNLNFDGAVVAALQPHIA